VGACGGSKAAKTANGEGDLMRSNPDTHHRRSIRLQDYDYSQNGAYFVTICTQNRAGLFGVITDGKLMLNDAGKMIDIWYQELHRKFHDIATNEYVIMPNHTHVIIVNNGVKPTVGADLRVCPQCVCPQHVHPQRACSNAVNDFKGGEHIGSPLHRVVQWFKTMTTNEYIRGVRTMNWLPFDKRLWQRNYYEHIIRNDSEYAHIAEYINNNPVNWKDDELWTS
jgi:REP element-mobilizing transposase RayT